MRWKAPRRNTEAAFGKVHVVCNNAGVAVGGGIDDDELHRLGLGDGGELDGVINGVQTFVNRIKSHGEGGHFVNTASMAGHIAVPGLGVYNTTKYAVVGHVRSDARRSRAARHRRSVLCPGVVTHEIFNSGRNRPAELQARNRHRDRGADGRRTTSRARGADAADHRERARPGRRRRHGARAIQDGRVLHLHASRAEADGRCARRRDRRIVRTLVASTAPSMASPHERTSGTTQRQNRARSPAPRAASAPQIARRFAEEGATVIVNDLYLDAARATRSVSSGTRARRERGRFADGRADVRRAPPKITARLDILVNNAGISGLEGRNDNNERLREVHAARRGSRRAANRSSPATARSRRPTTTGTG